MKGNFRVSHHHHHHLIIRLLLVSIYHSIISYPTVGMDFIETDGKPRGVAKKKRYLNTTLISSISEFKMRLRDTRIF